MNNKRIIMLKKAKLSYSFTSFAAQKFHTQKTFLNSFKWCPEHIVQENLIQIISDWLVAVLKDICSEKFLKISHKTNAGFWN